MAELIKPQNEGIRFGLWGEIRRESRKDVTQGYKYNPELVAAIIRSDNANIQQIEGGTHDERNELSHQQYQFLVDTYGLDVLSNPVLFAAKLAHERPDEKRNETLDRLMKSPLVTAEQINDATKALADLGVASTILRIITDQAQQSPGLGAGG